MTNSELILLSLIAECPRHGYEIETVIEERGMRNWTEIAFSSIYSVLKKLVRDGQATVSTSPAAGRGPARKVYAVTESGRQALREGVRRSLVEPDLGDQAFLFGLSCLPLLGPAGALDALASRRSALLRKKEELAQQLSVNLSALPAHVAAMFTYSVAALEAQISWLDGFISELQKGEDHA